MQQILLILQAAMSLLVAAQQPGTPPELQKQALVIAENAIVMAQDYLPQNAAVVQPVITGTVQSQTVTAASTSMYTISLKQLVDGNAQFQILADGSPVRSDLPDHPLLLPAKIYITIGGETVRKYMNEPRSVNQINGREYGSGLPYPDFYTIPFPGEHGIISVSFEGESLSLEI